VHETWFLFLKAEHRLRICENRVLRRIFGPTREEAAGGWRKLHNKELCDLSVRVIETRMRWRGHVAHMRERDIENFSQKTCMEKTTLEVRCRCRCRLQYIKTDLKEICCEGVDWIHVSQDRVQ
jgi:hypothetical protein